MQPYQREITLEAENAGCDRSGIPVVRGASFTLKPGEAIQLFGANGSGKTSLLALFAGHIRLAEGRVRWRDGEGVAQAAPFGHSLLFLGHEVSVKPALTAEENLFFWANIYGADGIDAKRNVIDALARVGMSNFRSIRAGRLSAGQRRRIDLARAFLVRREVWLLDEPAAAVDNKGAALIGDMISEHLACGGIAVIATHDKLKVASRRLEIG